MAGGGTIFTDAGPVDSALTLFLIQVLVIVVTCRAFGFLLKKIKQPLVIAEVVAGIVLGPTVMGRVPGFLSTLFPPSSLTTFQVFSQIGLCFFMFLIGLELDFGLFANIKRNAAISLTGIVLPFALGAAVGVWIFNHFAESAAVFGAFVPFFGVAMSITAFPVLARILSEKKLMRTRIGALTLSCAAVDDVVAWCILALCVALVRATTPLSALWTTLAAVGFVGIMLWPVRKAMGRFAGNMLVNNALSVPAFVVIFLVLFVSCWFAEIIGIHAMFGGFVLGLAVPRTHRIADRVVEKIEDLVMVFLLPLYFTYSGLRTQLGTVATGPAIGATVVIILTAMAGKIVGCGVACRLTGEPWKRSWALGFLMNTKGLVELIVLNIGLDYKVINSQVFSMMVVMALVTTFTTSPVIWVMQKWNWIPSGADVPAVAPDEEAQLSAQELGSSPAHVGPYPNLLLCVPHRIPGTGLVSVAEALLGDALRLKRARLTAAAVHRVTERPSSYIGSLLRREKAPHAASDTMRERARQLDVAKQLEELPIATVDAAADLLRAAAARDTSLTLVAWKDARGSEADVEFGRPFVVDVTHDNASDVAVFVDHGRGTDREMPARVRRLFCLCAGAAGDVRALALAAQAASVHAARPFPEVCVYAAPGGPSDEELLRPFPPRASKNARVVRGPLTADAAAAAAAEARAELAIVAVPKAAALGTPPQTPSLAPAPSRGYAPLDPRGGTPEPRPPLGVRGAGNPRGGADPVFLAEALPCALLLLIVEDGRSAEPQPMPRDISFAADLFAQTDFARESAPRNPGEAALRADGPASPSPMPSPRQAANADRISAHDAPLLIIN